MSDELCYLSVAELTTLFQQAKASPVELMQAMIERAERVEPDINAFSHRFFDEALDQAREAEARYSQGKPMGCLDGIPVAIKDEVDVEGQPCTEGSLIYKDRISDEDAVLAARLRAEGAIFHARTTCPEFCSLWNTHSRLFGVTRNPWNLEITPGGSSGGAGASLAAGTTTLASGSDIGGSIRFPSSQCGLTGFKPPFGRVPETYAPYTLESYCANGPMARSIADAAIMQNVISGAHPHDAVSTLPRVDLPLEYSSDLKDCRIAYTIDFGRLLVEADVRRNTMAIIDRLRDLGATLTEVSFNWPFDLEHAYNSHMDQLFYAHMAELTEQHRDEMCDYNIAMVEAGAKRIVDRSAFHDATCVEIDMYAEFANVMQGYDVLVCPSTCSTQLRADFNPAHEPYVVCGQELTYDLQLSPLHYFNMMGRCPTLSVPSGLGDNGVPTGLHIAATAYDDVAVFKVGGALESTWEKPFRPPGY